MIKTVGKAVVLFSKDGSKKLARFPFGPGKKYKNTKAAEAAARKREGQIQVFKKRQQESDTPITILAEQLSYSERQAILRLAFRKEFVPQRPMGAPYDVAVEDARPYLSEVFDNFILVREGAHYYRVGYKMDKKGDVTFDSRDQWKRAQRKVVVVEAHHDLLIEARSIKIKPIEDATLAEGEVGHADIAVITPGFGNKKDNHYYSREVLRRDSPVFKGTKMYVTNHTEGEHTVRNWVATVVESGQRFLSDGTPVARVAVHKKNFMEDLRNLGKLGILKKMELSILAVGKARKGDVDGKKANVVESITKAKAIDFVPSAGAGGHVLGLVEQAVGDWDLITAEALRERRPGLYDEIRADYHIREGTEANSMELQEQFDALAAETAELKEQYEALTEDHGTALEALVAQEQVVVKARAVNSLREQAKGKLPDAAITKLQKEIEAGVWEQDADVEAEVKELVEAEVKYVESVAKKETPKSEGVKGLGEGYQEDAGATEPATKEALIERSSEVDDLIAGYTGVETTWTKDHVQ